MIRITLLILFILANSGTLLADDCSNNARRGNSTPLSNIVPRGAVVPSGASTPDPASTPDAYNSGCTNMVNYSDCGNHPGDVHRTNIWTEDNEYQSMSTPAIITKFRWEVITLITIILSFITAVTAIWSKHKIARSARNN